MPQRKYADTDFFLALLKKSDWLKESAQRIYQQHANEIYVSPFTVAELMIICKRENIPLRETLLHISRIAKLENFSWDTFSRSCDFIEQGATIFDSLLMALCSENDQIISSDNMYEKFGFSVLDLKHSK